MASNMSLSHILAQDKQSLLNIANELGLSCHESMLKHDMQQLILIHLGLVSNIEPRANTFTKVEDISISNQTKLILKILPLLPDMDEKNLEEFFSNIERILITMNVEKDLWSSIIQHKLKGKAKATYLSIPYPICNEYDSLKEKIKSAYLKCSEYYRLKFRNSDKFPRETYKDLLHRKKQELNEYLLSSNVSSYEDLKNLMLHEQLLSSVPATHLDFLMGLESNSLHEIANKLDVREVIQKSAGTGSEPSASGKVKFEPSNSNTQFRPNTKNRQFFCTHCQKSGHTRDRCFRLKR